MEELHKVFVNGQEVKSLNDFLQEHTNDGRVADVLKKRICKRIATEKKPVTEKINGVEYEIKFVFPRGGRREGAGRPQSIEKKINFCATAETVRILEGVKNKSEYINKAVAAYGGNNK